jgi:hypothetical protein
VDQHDQLPAVDRDFDLMHVATLVRHLPLAGDLATARILGCHLQIGGLDNPDHLGGQHPGLGQGPDNVVEQGFQIPQVQLHDVIGQRIRADGPCDPWRLPVCGAPLADPMPQLLGIEAHQAHEGRITAQQGRQGMPALDAT